MSLWLECFRSAETGKRKLAKIHCSRGGEKKSWCGHVQKTELSRKLPGWCTYESALSLTECILCRRALIDTMISLGLLTEDDEGFGLSKTPASNTGVNYLGSEVASG